MKGWFTKLKDAFVARPVVSALPAGPAAVSVPVGEEAIEAPTLPLFEGTGGEPGLPVGSSSVGDGGVSLLERAEELLRARCPDEALVVLDRIEQGTPEWAQAQYRKATVLVSRSRLEEALEAVGRAVESREEAVFRSLQGGLLVRLGRGTQAEQALMRAVELNSPEVWTYLNLGYLLHTQKRSLEAVSVMRRGLAVKPADPVLAEHLGRFLLAAGQAPEAAQVLGRAVQDHGTVPTIHVCRSWALRACGDLAGAAASLRRAIELDDRNAEWKRQLAVLETLQTTPSATPPQKQG